MFEGIMKFFKKIGKKNQEELSSRDTAKERLHLVLMQDRANVSADFLEMMKQEIIEVIKKYIDVDEKEIDVRLTNKTNEDGTTGAPALYANIPIAGIKQEVKEENNVKAKVEDESLKEEKKIDNKKEILEKNINDKSDEKIDTKYEEKAEEKENNKSEENNKKEEKSQESKSVKEEKENKVAKKKVNKKTETSQSGKSQNNNSSEKKNEETKVKVNKPKKN